MRDLTTQELDRQLAEQLPARELMGGYMKRPMGNVVAGNGNGYGNGSHTGNGFGNVGNGNGNGLGNGSNIHVNFGLFDAA